VAIFALLVDGRQGRAFESGHFVGRDDALGDGRVGLDGAGKHDGWKGDKRRWIIGCHLARMQTDRWTDG